MNWLPLEFISRVRLNAFCVFYLEGSSTREEKKGVRRSAVKQEAQELIGKFLALHGCDWKLISIKRGLYPKMYLVTHTNAILMSTAFQKREASPDLADN